MWVTKHCFLYVKRFPFWTILLLLTGRHLIKMSTIRCLVGIALVINDSLRFQIKTYPVMINPGTLKAIGLVLLLFETCLISMRENNRKAMIVSNLAELYKAKEMPLDDSRGNLYPKSCMKLNWWKGKPSGSIVCTRKQQPRSFNPVAY